MVPMKYTLSFKNRTQLTVTRGEAGRREWGNEGEGSSQGTHMKDSWTRTMVEED